MKEEEKHKEVYDTGEEFLNKPESITIDQDSVIRKAEVTFLEDDEAEPFLNREYAEETKRIYSLLKDKHSMGDFESPKDRAIFDLVQDILRISGEKRVHDTGEEYIKLCSVEED